MDEFTTTEALSWTVFERTGGIYAFLEYRRLKENGEKDGFFGNQSIGDQGDEIRRGE